MYEIIKRIGSGSYGKVYSAKNKNELCAIKRTRISLQTLQEKEALINELKIIKFCNCPYIIKFIDCKFNGYNLDIITNYASMGDFEKIIRKKKHCFEESQLLCYFIQTTLGIKYLHNNNIIHRDIKSANIFLDSGDRVYVGDFGISKILKNKNSLAATQIGTPYYMSPEIIKSQNYSTDVDMWALGCFLYELITLYPPFSAYSMHELTLKINKINFYKKLSQFHKYFSKNLLDLVPLFFFDAKKRISIDEVLKTEIISNNMYLIPYVLSETKNMNITLPNNNELACKSWTYICKLFKKNSTNDISSRTLFNQKVVLPPINRPKHLNNLEKPNSPFFKKLLERDYQPKNRRLDNKIIHNSRWIIPSPKNKEFGKPPPLPNILTHYGNNNKDNYKSNYNINYNKY